MISRPTIFFGGLFALVLLALSYLFALSGGTGLAIAAVAVVAVVIVANFAASRKAFKPPSLLKGETLLFAAPWTWTLRGLNMGVWPVAVTNKRLILGGFLPLPSFALATNYWFGKPPRENFMNLRAWPRGAGGGVLGSYARFEVEAWPLRGMHYKLMLFDENAANALRKSVK